MEQFHKQKIICEKYGASFNASPSFLKIGVSRNIINNSKELLINGLRHKPDMGTTGWFIWAGDYSNDGDFFIPVHVDHLNEFCPNIIQYLGLAPGWRFLVSNEGYEDVWFDEMILS